MNACAKRRLLTLLTSAAVALTTTAALAFEAKIDSFQVRKNSTTLLFDTFSDNAPPPSADSDVTSYDFVQGGFSETSGKLTINAATAPIAVNLKTDLAAATTYARSAGATFVTNISTNSNLGLRSTNEILVSGIFDLVSMPTRGDGYGIRLTDRNAQGLLDGNDVLELGVFHRDNDKLKVVLRRQNFLTGLITTYSVSTPDVDLTKGQIEFLLAKSSDQTSGITATYRYVVAGTAQADTLLRTTELDGITPIQVFHDENWTRAEFFATQTAAVPEPETYVMILAGVGLVGWQLRRKSRRSKTTRIV